MASDRHIHVVGAGMAGLSAALQLTLAGEKVTVYEAAPFAGGRCRSYLDRELDCRVDNGNHLALTGNAAIHDYLFLTNALDSMKGPGAPEFPFMDLATGERWVTRMGMGKLPWWIFNPARRIKGTAAGDYLSILKIICAGPSDSVAARLDTKSLLYRRFWEPLGVAVLNTEPEIASARLLANVLRQSFLSGGRACCPIVPKTGLSESFVMPCLNVLRQHGTEVKFGYRLRGITLHEKTARLLDFSGEKFDLGKRDWLILAVPSWVAQEILPKLTAPNEFRSIINAHYRVQVPHNPAGFTGMVGGTAEWAFAKQDVVSVTISAAERHTDHPVREMAKYVWRDLARLYDLDPEKVPPHRIVKEKRATFAATPAQEKLRPASYTQWKNIALAGDWTATGLPSTIEGAIRSGLKASQVVMRWAG